MKILIYSKVFLPVTGGIQTVVSELARGLAEKGWDDTETIEVTVVTRTKTPYDDTIRRHTGSCETLIYERDSVCQRSRHRPYRGPAMLPMALGLLFRKPVVVEHHGYQSICPNGLLVYQPDHSLCPGYFMQKQYQMCIRCNTANLGWTRSLRSLVLTFPRRWLCQKVSRNIAVSEHVCKRISLPRTKVVYHGVEGTVGILQDQDLTGDENPLQIGSVGRLVSEKGLPTLLRAAKRLDDEGTDFRLTFVGDGPERANLENLARNLRFRNQVEFLGELQGHELGEALRSVRVIVMPSQWEETAGLAAIEHMMRGGVVIASDIGGLGEIVGEAGLRFKAGDSEALYACLRDIIEIPSLRASLSVAARRRAMQIFDRNSMIEGHVSAYREALHR